MEDKTIYDYREVNIEVDENKGFFNKADLNQDEIWYLLRQGYIISSHADLKGIKRTYLLKPRYNETKTHFFLIKEIESHIKQYTDNIWLYETKGPDIIFKPKKKKIAIEVETGIKYNKDKKYLKEKVNMLNKTYKKWFFVVTRRDYKRKYETLGTTYLRTQVPQIMKKLFRGVSCERIRKGEQIIDLD